MIIETTSNTPSIPSIEQEGLTEGGTTVVISGDTTAELPTDNGLVKVTDGSPMMAKFLLPVVAKLTRSPVMMNLTVHEH